MFSSLQVPLIMITAITKWHCQLKFWRCKFTDYWKLWKESEVWNKPRDRQCSSLSRSVTPAPVASESTDREDIWDTFMAAPLSEVEELLRNGHCSEARQYQASSRQEARRNWTIHYMVKSVFGTKFKAFT